MGICQSRPEVESSAAGNNGGSSSAKASGGKGSLLLRRRPSETSLCTIIPEATDHLDNDDLERMMWNDETDADSLTERGKVYRKQAGGANSNVVTFVVTKGMSGAAAGGGSTIQDVASPALTEPTVQSSVAEEDASTAVASSSTNNGNNVKVGGAGIRQRQANYLRALRGSKSSGSGSGPVILSPNSFATTLASPFSISSSAMSAASSPLPSSALLHEYDDDDSTALPAEDDDDEEEDQAPTDEEDDYERGDVDGPGRLVPVPTSPSAADKEAQASLASPPASVAEAESAAASGEMSPSSSSSPSSAVVSPARSVDAPGWRAKSLLQRSMLDASVVSTSPSASLQSTSSMPAVHPRTLSEFHRIEIQSKLAQQVHKKQAKAQKYNDRKQDVQTYKQLYKEYEQLTQKVNGNGGEGSVSMVASPDPTTASSASVAVAASVRSQPKAMKTTTPAADAFYKFANSRGRSTTPASASAASLSVGGGHSNGVRANAHPSSASSRRTQSFDLHDSNNWFFDFQGTEFVYEGPQQQQASLSLLSESSLEVQRRLYAEKRRQRKLQKKKLWRGTPGRSLAMDETPSVSTPMSNLMSTMSSIVRRDYGPVRQSRGSVAAASGAVVDNIVADYGPSTDAPALMTLSEMPSSSQGEWVDQEINCIGNVGGTGHDDAEYSILSDMGDTASYTSNDYRVGPSRRFLAASMYSSRAGNGSATQDKLSELEAKILALERANSCNVSSPHGGPGTEAAGASTPVASSSAAPGDNLKTPLVTNRVASLRTIFEPASNHPGEKGEQDSSEVVSSSGLEAQAGFAASVGEPTVAFETPMHQLESIEESLISAASSVSTPAEDASPAKSLLGEDLQGESPIKRGDNGGDEIGSQGSIHEELFPADDHDESIDLPPDDDEETIDLLQESSPAPVASEDSDVPPLRQLDTVSTGASLDDEEEKKEEEEDREADPLATPVKDSRAPPSEMSGDDDEGKGDEEDDNDIFDLLVRGNEDRVEQADQLETVTPTKLQGSASKAEMNAHRTPRLSTPSMYMVPKKVPVDPPGAALLDGTPSLETKRRPVRPMGSLLSPTKASTGSTPTPQVSPVRRMPMNSSPAGSPSPIKNRWIAELSTHQFLAISEENALERLARLERNESTPTMFDTDPESMATGSAPEEDTILLVENIVDDEDVKGEKLIADAESAVPCDPLATDGSSYQVEGEVSAPYIADGAQLEAANLPVVTISAASDGDESTRPPVDCIGSVLPDETVEDVSIDGEMVVCHVEPGVGVPDADPSLSDKEQIASDVPASIVASDDIVLSDPTGETILSGTESVEESRPSEFPVHGRADPPPSLLNFQKDEASAEAIDAPSLVSRDEELQECGPVLEATSSCSTEINDEVKVNEEHSVEVLVNEETASHGDDVVSEPATCPEARAESTHSCEAVVADATLQEADAAIVAGAEACARDEVERTSVNTAATSFVTAISSSAVLMEAWDDTAEHEDAYASFGQGGDFNSIALRFAESESPVKRADISVLDTSQHGTDPDIGQDLGALPGDAPDRQASSSEGGIVIDKSFASIARVSRVILATDNASNAYFNNGSLRTAPRNAAAADSEYDDAPHDELHSDESMSVHNKSHASHEAEDASYHSDSTRPSTNVKQLPSMKQPTVVEDDTPLPLSAPTTDGPSVVADDDDDTNVAAEPNISSSSSYQPEAAPAPWSKSLELASAVEQQVQQVLERYRQEGDANGADDDDEAPDDELHASLSVSRTN